MTDSEITKARAAVKMLRANFEAEKVREWERVSAAAQERVATAVWEARQAGVSVAQIAREYGTTSRNTIYDLLRTRDHDRIYTTPDPTTTPASVKVTPVPESENTNGYPNPKRISVVNYEGYTGSADYYTLNNGMNMLIDDTFEPNTSLFKAFWDTNSEVYTAMKEAQNVHE